MGMFRCAEVDFFCSLGCHDKIQTRRNVELLVRHLAVLSVVR